MFERDYLMRLIFELASGIRRALERGEEKDDPAGAARMLDLAIGDATDIDASVLLALSPDSIASIMQVSGVDPQVGGYVGRSMLLAAWYYDQAGEREAANLRRAQGLAISRAYGVDVDGSVFDADAMKRFLAS